MSARPGFTAVCADLLRAGVPVRFAAPGHSMQPAIRDGETLLVEPCEPARLRRGEVVLALAPGGPIVHRLQRRLPDGRLVLRGDALANADEPCAPAACLGRVTVVERDGQPTIPGPAPSRLRAGACR
jgi:signal peptidase I